MVQLIDDEVGRTLADRTAVAVPTLGIGALEVKDIRLLTIDTHSLGKDTRGVAMTGVEDVGLSLKVALDSGRPQTVAHLGHLHFFLANLDVALGIVGGEEFEHGLLGRIGHLIEGEVLGTGNDGHEHESGGEE